jgi:protein-S-isoprenylcysteine O-methyltransferase Ste14
VAGQRPLPPTYLLLGLVAMAALHFALPGPRLVEGGWRLLGVPLAILGAWLNIWADAWFKRVGTEIKPFRESKRVVTEGPFRFSRNPMYLGFLGILAGAAILAGTLAPMLVVIVMAWLFSAHFVVPEERHLEEQFGDSFREYKARVRRWL